MWQTVGGAASTDELIAEYRRIVSRSIPEVSDDRLVARQLTAVCLAFAIERVGSFQVLDARAVGEQGRLNRVVALEAAAIEAKRTGG